MKKIKIFLDFSKKSDCYQNVGVLLPVCYNEKARFFHKCGKFCGNNLNKNVELLSLSSYTAGRKEAGVHVDRSVPVTN
jgi:hypothetical protein